MKLIQDPLSIDLYGDEFIKNTIECKAGYEVSYPTCPDPTTRGVYTIECTGYTNKP